MDPDTRGAEWRADGRLIAEALRGRDESLLELSQRLRCVPRVLAILNARRGGYLTSHDLEDLRQDTLVIIWRKLRTFAGPGTLEMWAQKIAYFEFMNGFRDKRRKSERRAGEDVERVPAPPSGDLDPERYSRLEAALDELGSPEGDVVRLKHFEQLTFREIAERLDISANTVKSQYYRGIQRLKSMLPVQLRGEEAE